MGSEMCIRDRLNEDNEHLINCSVDLSDTKATSDAIAVLANKYDINTLIHNAGVIRPDLIEDVKLEDLAYLTDLHLSASVVLVQGVLDAMKKQSFGRIVIVSSRAMLGLETRTSYSATKAGQVGLTRTLAMELGQYGITQYGYLVSLDQNSTFIVPFSDFGGTTENLGESNTSIFRAKHSINDGSYIGGILSDRRYKDGIGTMGGVDGLYRFYNNLKFDWQLFLSNTSEPNDPTLSSSINGHLFGKDSLTSDFDGESY